MYLHIGFLCVQQLLNHHAQALSDSHVARRGSGVVVFSGVWVPVDLRHEDGRLGERLIEVARRLWVLQEERRHKFDFSSDQILNFCFIISLTAHTIWVR